MMHWVRTRSPLVRTLVYAALVILGFALAAGVGAMAALMLRGDLTGFLERQGPRPADEQAVNRAQQKDSAAEQEEAAAGQKEAASPQDQDAADRSAGASQRDGSEYLDAVEDIQTNAVETFLENHEKLLRYDALDADDVREMKANEAALQEMSERAADLDPPRKYGGQHEVFVSALDALHEASRLAHGMAADPVAAAELGFDEYDGRVKEASALLRRSNELLGEDHATIEDVREVSPEF